MFEAVKCLQSEISNTFLIYRGKQGNFLIKVARFVSGVFSTFYNNHNSSKYTERRSVGLVAEMKEVVKILLFILPIIIWQAH